MGATLARVGVRVTLTLKLTLTLTLTPTLTLTLILTLTRRGAFSASLAEYAITAALHFTKQVPRCMRNREDKVWDKFEMSMLRGKTLGLVGYGDIAKASRSNPSHNPNANSNPNPNPSPNPDPDPNQVN